LYFRVPGNKNEGETSRQVVSILDIYPTIIDLCGLPESEKLERNSLTPLLENTEMVWEKPVLNTWYYKNHAVLPGEPDRTRGHLRPLFLCPNF